MQEGILWARIRYFRNDTWTQTRITTSSAPMLANLLIVLPIFALILTGWLARRLGALGPNATREVNRVVVYLALPALLFDITANAVPSQIWQPGFLAAFTAGYGTVFAFTIWFRMRQGSQLADAAIDGLNTSYANTGFMGFPLVLAVIGEPAMAATLIATIVTACMLFALAIVLIESGLQTETRRRDITRKICLSLAKNPLLVAPLLGEWPWRPGFKFRKHWIPI